MTIKALVFDIGEVVLKEDAIRARKMLCDETGISPETFKKFAIANIQDSYTGLNGNEFFNRLIKQEKLDFTPEKLSSIWIKARHKTTQENTEVIDLLKRFSKDYTLISFTDSTLLNDAVRKTLGVYELFDVNLISHKSKYSKKQSEFYEILNDSLTKRNIPSAEVVYIDDKQDNLTRAQEIMPFINTILYQDNRQLFSDLAKLGVNA